MCSPPERSKPKSTCLLRHIGSSDWMPTFYEELCVPCDIDQAALKKALKKKALEYHPDKHPSEQQQMWTEKFQHLQLIMETFESEKSRSVYDEIHLRKERTNRILVLMDMNGSLLCKLGKDGRDGYPGKRSIRPDFSDKNNDFWVRPHAKEFLESILHPASKIAFAIYTSRQMRNALPQVTMLFKSIGRPELQEKVFAIFAGDEFSVPDPDAGCLGPVQVQAEFASDLEKSPNMCGTRCQV